MRSSNGESTSGRAAGGNGELSSSVWWLVGLDDDHVFRAVVNPHTSVENQSPMKRPWGISFVCHTTTESSVPPRAKRLTCDLILPRRLECVVRCRINSFDDQHVARFRRDRGDLVIPTTCPPGTGVIVSILAPPCGPQIEEIARRAQCTVSTLHDNERREATQKTPTEHRIEDSPRERVFALVTGAMDGLKRQEFEASDTRSAGALLLWCRVIHSPGRKA